MIPDNICQCSTGFVMTFSLLISFGLILFAYLLGSIPTGYLVALVLKGIDIREYGSGSTGATNVLRTVGKGAALTVLLIDMLKGILAVASVKLFFYLWWWGNIANTMAGLADCDRIFISCFRS